MIWNGIRPYVLHLRPKSFFIVTGHMLFGVVMALLLNNANIQYGDIIIAVVSWTVLLNGGALAYNSYFDRDKGSVNWLDKPPMIPAGLHIYALILMALGLLILYSINMRIFIAGAICTVLSIMYSTPPLILKKRAWINELTNSLCYATLTAYAGYAVFDLPLDYAFIIVLVCLFILGFGSVPIAEIYQNREDKERGYKTVSLVLGTGKTLIFSMTCMNISFLIIFAGGALGYLNRAVFIMVPFYLYFLHYYLSWYRRHTATGQVDEKKELYKGYLLCILWDGFFILAYML
ncbi:MAG: UbiA family prenyltransferase [archaeon]